MWIKYDEHHVHVADVLGLGKHFKFPPPRHPLPTVSFLFPRIFSSHHYIRPAFSDPFIMDQLQINDFSFCHGSLNRMIIWQGTTEDICPATRIPLYSKESSWKRKYCSISSVRVSYIRRLNIQIYQRPP